MRQLRHLALLSITLLPVSARAQADPTFLVGDLNTLYRYRSGIIESFDMGQRLRGMHTDLSTGIVYVATSLPQGATQISVLNNAASGTPSLTLFSTLSHFYGSLTKIGDLFYGFDQDALYAMDLTNPSAPVETYIGSTGVSTDGGAAYNKSNDRLYMASFSTNSLYTVNRATGHATLVGPMGMASGDLGMEWWQQALYVATQNFSTGLLDVGVLNESSGAYSRLFSLNVPAASVATSLAIVPEPTVCILMLAALCYRRRRRLVVPCGERWQAVYREPKRR